MGISYQKKRQTPKRKAVGSNPARDATSEWSAVHSKSPALWLGFSHTAPLFLLTQTHIVAGFARAQAPVARPGLFSRIFCPNLPFQIGNCTFLFFPFLFFWCHRQNVKFFSPTKCVYYLTAIPAFGFVRRVIGPFIHTICNFMRFL